MLVPWQSKVPAAIDELVALLTAELAGSDVTIRDGPWVEGGEDTSGTIVIGWTGFFSAYQYPRFSQAEDIGAGAVTSTAALDGLGGGIRETFTINCASLVRGGNTRQMSAARSMAYSNVKAVADVVGPPWLGGTVMKAVFGSGSTLGYTQDRRGILVVLTFSIDCTAQASQ